MASDAWLAPDRRAGRAVRSLAHAVATARLAVANGSSLPKAAWQRRHRAMVTFAWANAVGLLLFALARGYPLHHSLVDTLVVGAPAALASWSRLSAKARSAAAAFSLITASAVLVHLWDGTIEAHFHFFVVVSVLTLYQDWLPYLLAIGYVVVHHGVMGTLAADSVFNHPSAVAHPWRWALIHGSFVLAASVAGVISWRMNEALILRDALTGLPNRTLFGDRLAMALARARRSSGCLAVLFIDLDGFKQVNDRLGHRAGDVLLTGVADRLSATVRPGDTVARMGGDEFTVLCESLGDQDAVTAVADRVAMALGEPFEVEGQAVTCPASIGIALAAGSRYQPEELLRDADAAM
jgi:diguanylate cyclase (GGDEF)-like protein